MQKYDFILFSSIFNPDLGEAIIKENEEKVEEVFRRDFDYEIAEGSFVKDPETALDVKQLHKDYIAMGEDDDFAWAK